MSFSEKFNYFNAPWDLTESNNKTLENLRSRLIMEEIRLKEKEISYTNESVTYMVKNESRGKDVCHFCKKKGHWKADCPKLKKRREYSGSANTAIASMTCSEKLDSNIWYDDCAASNHMTCEESLLKNIAYLDTPIEILLGDNHSVYGLAVGDVYIQARVNGQWHSGIITNVLYVPTLKYNLFSVGAASEKGLIHIQDCYKCEYLKDGVVQAQGYKRGRMYVMDFRIKEETIVMSIKSQGVKEVEEVTENYYTASEEEESDDETENIVVRKSSRIIRKPVKYIPG